MEGKKPAQECVIMEMLSQEYGWTPSQIRAERACDIDAYIQILNERALIQKHAQMKK